MTFKFGDGKAEVDMVDYVKNMMEEFPIKFYWKKTIPNPASPDMFDEGHGKYLPEEK